MAAGLATLPGLGYGAIDDQARRMIDAKAPGLARLITGLADASGADFDRRAAARLGAIQLLCDAVDRAVAGGLPEPLVREVEAAVGIAASAAELATRPAREGRWQCYAQVGETDDRLRVRRSLLIGPGGASTQVIQYAHGNAPMDARLVVGRWYEGLIAHPGSGWRSALPEGDVTSGDVEAWAVLGGFDDLLAGRAAALAGNPWQRSHAAPVRGVRLSLAGEVLRATDAAGRTFDVKAGPDDVWQLLAATGGAATDLAVELDEGEVRVRGVLPATAKEAAA